MAIKSIAVSDISNVEIPDDQHVRAVIEHPDFTQPLEIDLSSQEAEKFQSTALRLVSVTVFAPNEPARHVTVETRTLDKLFDKVDFNKVLEGARKAEGPASSAPRRGRPAKAAAPKSSTPERIDYTAPDRYGQLHRGRINEEEARLVRENRDRASKNRQAQTGQPINFEDAKEKSRYGL